jgi:predicted RNA binding protein YcfA (HicA-like mRNA interferase family)
MASAAKLFDQILRGNADASVRFSELRSLLLRLGFEERTSGSHHLFSRPGIRELVNLQRDGSNAKPYQIRQVRRIIVEYKLQKP